MTHSSLIKSSLVAGCNISAQRHQYLFGPQRPVTPLTYLKDHAIDPGLCSPHHPAIVAGREWLSHTTPQIVTLWIDSLARCNALEAARSMLFGTDLPLDKWPDILRDAPNLSLLVPDLLCDPGLVLHPAPESLDKTTKIHRYCIGLISRPFENSGQNPAASDFFSILKTLGISLLDHARAMLELRAVAPAIFAATIADEAWTAIAVAGGIADKGERDSVTKTIVRHWLLHRAFHLQRGFAYVRASRRSATPAPLRAKFGLTDVTAVAAGAYVDTLAADTVRHLSGYARALSSRGKAGKPGCTSKPIDFVTALIPPEWEQAAFRPLIVRSGKALALNYPAFLSKVPTVVRIKSRRITFGQRAKASLHDAAKHPPPELRRLTLFEIWHYGLNPAALLLMLTARFCQAAAIARIMLDRPELAILGAASDFAISVKRAEIMAIAQDMATAIIPNATPSFSSPGKNFKLAYEFSRRHSAGSVALRNLGERQMYQSLDPLYNALPPHLAHLS